MDLSQDQPRYAARTVVTTLLVTDLVDSTKLVDQLGDAKAAQIFARQDRLARDLLQTHGGQEIDKTDGFLMLFFMRWRTTRAWPNSQRNWVRSSKFERAFISAS